MTTGIEQYDRVRVITDRFLDEGAAPGTRGYVLEVYPDGNFEIEVSDQGTGETIAQFVAVPGEVELDE